MGGKAVISVDIVILVVLFYNKTKSLKKKIHIFVDLPVAFEVSDQAVNTASLMHIRGLV